MVLTLLSLLLVGCDNSTDSDTGKGSGDADLDYDGWTVDEGDCDDLDPDVHPGAPEVYYDGVDQDCDGVDADDQDDDGYGIADDCNDTDAEVYPGATEVCDGEDNDCNDQVDDNAADAFIAYADTDADGYGDEASQTTYCGDLPDGYAFSDTDCDDTNAEIHPDAPEVCDGFDNDCDSEIDEDQPDPVSYYADADGDGHGDPAVSTVTCSPPDGYVADGDDCDDTNAAIYPGAAETCNGVDDDCSGTPDDNVTDGGTWYVDADADGYGDDATAVMACEQPEGTISLGGDCDDTDATASPSGVETCDGVDNDCNGTIDDGFSTTAFYADSDGDTYGDAAASVLACEQPEGYVSDNTDCDDTNPANNPAGTEVCDGADNNCDGSVDESGDAVLWYVDGDGDGYGDAGTGVESCSSPGTGYVIDAGDCNDADASVNPAAVESCDGVDNNCDGATDEAGASGAPTWYADADGDAYGDAGMSMDACSMPTGYVANSSDCNDGDLAVNPDAVEACDGIDNDCNGTVDDGYSTTPSYADADGDGFGDPSVEVDGCVVPEGYVADNTDCDDTSASVNPAAAEVCDGLDNDCNGSVDDGAPTTTWYADADADGYGDDGTAVASCTAPEGYVDMGGDCDDADVTSFPGADELCDGVDNDCDGAVDDGVAYGTYYDDVDGDGYGDDSTAVTDCSTLEGKVTVGGDCDDGTSAANPGATEVCDGIDNDCDGLDDEAGAVGEVTSYADADGDSYGNASVSTTSCSVPSGYVADKTDCNDTSAAANPGATEVCDGIDNDCDGSSDEAGATGSVTGYRDADGDTYGSSATSTTACSLPSGYVLDATDCNDGSAAVHPGATELCDGLDNDCDGGTDEAGATGETTTYADADGDGYGNASLSSTGCSVPSGYVSDKTDCNDTTALAHPGATEACDGIDNDCDGASDEAGATGEVTSYRDSDGDGYGLSSASSTGCSVPSGYNLNGGDCDDGAAAVNPGATEVCNDVDDDCDGGVDVGAIDAVTVYPDLDLDGYGDESAPDTSCSPPADYIADGSDCDDTNDYSYPGAVELCDGEDNNCSGSTADEAGTAWLYDGGTWTDWTDLLAAGTASSPVFFGDPSAYTARMTSGTLYLCDGTWYAKGVFSTMGTTASVVGRHGADVTTLSAGGINSGSVISVTSATITVEGLTLTGGKGSTSSTYGGGVIAQKTSAPVATTPNLTLIDCIVTGNNTAYGGGAAVLKYAWIDIIDTVIDGNSATGAGGGLWIQDYGEFSCTASDGGYAAIINNTSAIGGGAYLSNKSNGTIDTVGCDWGTDSIDDNATYDIRIAPGSSGPGYCYAGDGTDVLCSAGSCTASTDATCP